jgi:AcrR family transcriptional regulator
MGPSREKTHRLSREEWLAKALDVIASKPHGKLRIHELVKDLGVTRGSFYWHFKGREDFVRSMAEFYDRWSTDQVIAAVEAGGGDAKQRLRTIMEVVFRNRLGRYEMALHAWAFQEPVVEEAVRRSEENRLAFVRTLFEEMGFTGRELDTRVRAFVGYMNLDHSSFAREGDAERLRLLEERLEFFTRP